MKHSLSLLQLSVSHLLINKALRNAGASPTHEHIWPMQCDCHCSCTGKFILHACIACQHYAIISNTSQLLTCQEVQGVDASVKGLRVHLMHKG